MPALQNVASGPIIGPEGNTKSVVSVSIAGNADMKREQASDAVQISYYGRTVVDASKLLKEPRVRELVRQIRESAKKRSKAASTANLTPTY